MNKIHNVAELNAAREEYGAILRRRHTGTNGRRTIVTCGGTGCLSCDSAEIKAELIRLIEEKHLQDRVHVHQAGCFGFCSQGPFVKIYPEQTLYRLVKVEDAKEIIESDIEKGQLVDRLLYVDPITKEKAVCPDEYNFYKKQKRIALYGCGVINPENIYAAIGYDAMQAAVKVLTTMTPQEVINEILASGLRGRGGGGFPTGKKWQFAHDMPGEVKYIVCNGDEGDPGAFMDRAILEDNPMSVIEGMMIAGYAIGAHDGYVYVRAEYPLAVAHLQKIIKDANEIGLLGKNILGLGFDFQIHIRLGAGAFVCGEETALLNSIQGMRGNPRPRPPFPAVSGLWGKPTVINNVETLATIPYIIRQGASEYAKVGTDRSKGTKVFALGGKVNNVGLVEIPMGTTMRELIFDIGGGIPNGKKFKAIQTGGPSGGCLTEAQIDVPIDYDNLISLGSMMGSGGAIVMDEDNCMVDVAKFYMEFIVDESCGKCSPCRIGTKRMLELLTKITDGKGTVEDLYKLRELAQAVKDGSLCGLGQTAANPVISTLNNFYSEYLAHVVDKKCPAHVCKNLMEYFILADKCKKCGSCARNCPANTISGVLGKEPFFINQDKCIKCGMCMASCRFGAIIKR